MDLLDEQEGVGQGDSLPHPPVRPRFGGPGKAGRPIGSSNLHSKHPSSIAVRLRKCGLDWVEDLARALRANDRERIAVWMRLLPYLIVTQGHRRPKRPKGRASRAALEALKELEGE